jgi:hypothetical protein
MPFKKGVVKHPNSGRKVGQVAKTKNLKMKDLLDSKDINPVEKLLELLPDLEKKDQAKIWLDISSYCYTKPRDSETQIIVDKFLQIVNVLGPEKVDAIASGITIDSLETRMLQKLSKEQPELYKTLLLSEGDDNT